MPNKFDDLAEKANQLTQEQFKDQLSSLTSLTNEDTANIINNTGISHEDLATVLKVVKDDTADNESKAQSISSISKGVATLVSIASKFL